MKRYRLKIPEMINKDYCRLVSDIYSQKECKKHPTIESTEFGHTLVQMCTVGEQTYSIPSDWLEEIIECCKCGKDVSNGDWDWLDDWKKEKICEDCFNASIKSWPMSAEEYVEKTFPVKQYEKKTYWQNEDIRLAFIAGEENQKLRHRATPQAYEKWWANAPISTYGPYDYAYQAWQACKKAHNLPEEE